MSLNERKQLTDRGVAAIKPKAKRYDVADTVRVGLRVRVTPTGHKTWIFEKRIKGGPIRSHTLGHPPTISLAKARELAAVLAQEAELGIDRKAEVAAQVATGAVLDGYLKRHVRKLRSGATVERQLEYALGSHREKPIKELTTRDLQRAIDKKAETAPVHANRIKAALSAFTKYAWRRDEIETDVGAKLIKAVAEKPRTRVLSLDEVRAIYNAAEALGPLWTPIVRLMVLTAQRQSEIVGLSWHEVDPERSRYVLPPHRSKNGRGHVVHLSQPALDALPERDEKSKTFLLFSTTGRTPVSGFSKLKRNLDALLPEDMEHWTFHDLRTAFATQMAERGANEQVVDRILNHTTAGTAASAVARVYNQADRLPERAKVLDDWAELVTGEETKVVQIFG